MWECYAAGWRAAGRCAALIVVVYGVGASGAAVFGAAVWVWLQQALDGSLATRTLLTGLDANVFIDLVVHHGDSLATLGVTAAVLVLGGVIVWVWLNAALVAAVAGADGVRAGLRRGWGLFPVFARLWGLALGAAAVLLGLDWLAVRVVIDWAAARGSGPPPLLVAAGGGVGAVVGLLVLVAVHDHARIRTAVTGDPAVRAYAWAWRFVWRSSADAVLLVGVLAVTAATVWAVEFWVRWYLVPTTATGVTVSVVVAQVAALARVAVRAWWFAAETALQHGGPGSVG